MLIELMLSFVSALVALIISVYGILTVNLKLATTRFFKWLPYVCTYNKRLVALNKLAKLDKDMTSESEKHSGIMTRWGILNKGEIGYHEMLNIIEKGNLESPDEIIYEQKEQPEEFDTVTNQQRIRLLTSLKVKIGNKIVTIKDIDPYDPMRIMTDLKESIKLKLWEIIATVTFGGGILLFLLTLTLSILKTVGVIK